MTDCPEAETIFPHPQQPMALDDYESWTATALEWIEAQHGTFTADDLRAALPTAPHANLIGAAFNTAANRKLIQVTGYQRSNAPSRRHSLLRVWETTPKGIKPDFPPAA
jgi:hypothetical protein